MKTQHVLILWVMAALLFGGKAFAQTSSAQIKGQVLSSSAQALEYANVLLHKASDSTVVKLEYTQADGSFHIANVEPGQYRIAVSFVGYPNYLSQIHELRAGQELNLPAIKLQEAPAELQGITVKAQKPILEIRPDKVFKIEYSFNHLWESGIFFHFNMNI